jgi:hypothetical protein
MASSISICVSTTKGYPDSTASPLITSLWKGRDMEGNDACNEVYTSNMHFFLHREPGHVPYRSPIPFPKTPGHAYVVCPFPFYLISLSHLVSSSNANFIY